MNNYILFIITLFIPLAGISQESRDYLDKDETYQHGVSLYDKNLYPSANQIFQSMLQETDLFIIPDEQTINAELYEALSATFSGKQNGIVLVNRFISKYPEHPNTSVAHLELGKYYFKQQNFNQAASELAQVNQEVLTDDQREDYNMSMGYTSFVQKNFGQAERFLNSVALGQSAYKEQAIYYLGLSQYFLKKYEDAKRNLSLVASNPRYQNEIPYYYARILFEEQKYDEVITYLEPRMNGQLANNVEVNQILGQSYYNLEEYQKALPYLNTYSSETTSQSPEALYQLAYTQYKLGQYPDAIKNFEKLNIVNNEIGQYALYALGESYIKVGDKEKALQAFDRASAMTFNATITETSMFNKAKLSYELGRNNDAISLMQTFRSTYPRSAYSSEADELLVDMLITSTNYTDALNVLKNIKPRSALMDEAYQKVSYYRAVELYNAGDLSQAKPLLDQVIATPSDQRFVALANYWLGEMAYEYHRYPTSIDYLNKFLNSPVNKPEQYINQANYTLGYCYYNQDVIAQAGNYFSKIPAQQAGFGADASLRLGDVYFLQKQYSQAQQAYKQVNQATDAQQDYASYQIAILEGLQGKAQSKVQLLNRLYTQNPQSAYADDALLEEGRVYLTQENYAKAESTFKQLIRSYPNSDQVKQAYNDIGLLHFNQGDYEEALVNYERVVENYPNTDEASAALQAIEQIYITQGRADAYFAYVKTLSGQSVSTNDQERISYLAAETPFKNGDCATAQQGFTSYLNKFPAGFYSANAHFYRGECFSQSGQIEKAIADFDAVTQMPDNKFTERSLIRVARFNYKIGEYSDAVSDYQRLEQLNKGGESTYGDEIQVGLMQSYNLLDQREKALTYAKKVLGQQQVEPSVKAEAQFISGWSLYKNNNYAEATKALEQSMANLRSQYGAEARYLIAHILYQQKQYSPSIDAAYRVSDETPSEDDWVARSFILIGRDYKELGELFQAKATVKSVLENYSGNDQAIIQEGNALVNEIEQLELSNSNLNDNQQNSNQLQLKDQ